MLDLKLLTTFREVALRRSFSDAATVLGYTQPAVSQHVSRLEATVGVRLLERDARGVHPTPAGELLLTRASALLDAAPRARAACWARGAAPRTTSARRRAPAVPPSASGRSPRSPAPCCPAPRATCAPAVPTCAWTSRCSSPKTASTRCSPIASTSRRSSTPSCCRWACG